MNQDEPNEKVKPEGKSVCLTAMLLGCGAGREVNNRGKTESAPKHVTSVFSGH